MSDLKFEEWLHAQLEKGSRYTLITLKVRFKNWRKSAISYSDIETVLAEAKAEFPVLDKRNTRKYAKETQAWAKKWLEPSIANGDKK